MAIFSSTIKSSNLLSDSFLYFLTLNRSGWPKGKDTMTSEKKLLVINFCKCRFSYGLHVHFSGLLFFLWLATMSRFVVVKQKYSFCITIEVHTWCLFSYSFLLKSLFLYSSKYSFGSITIAIMFGLSIDSTWYSPAFFSGFYFAQQTMRKNHLPYLINL